MTMKPQKVGLGHLLEHHESAKQTTPQGSLFPTPQSQDSDLCVRDGGWSRGVCVVEGGPSGNPGKAHLLGSLAQATP